jgi:hypothetical protein
MHNTEEVKKWFDNPAQFRENITNMFSNTIIPIAVERLNVQFSPNRLSKQSRIIEPLPTDQRQLSSYRTRLGTMLEYGLSTEMERLMREYFGDSFFLTFAVAHEFPDFYLRDTQRKAILKIEMKAVDADSDEQAARFDVLTSELDEFRDFILFMGWKWVEKTTDNIQWEFPKIFSFAFVSAYEIGKVRDIRLYAIGGKIENGEVLVPSTKNPGTFTKDPGNFGKLWRIFQKKERKNSTDLSNHAKDFLRFLTDVDNHAPRKRIG